MYNEVEKLKRVLVTHGYSNMSKKDLLEGKTPERPVFKPFLKVIDNVIMFTATDVRGKGKVTIDETIRREVIVTLVKLVKTYHR